MNKLMRKTMCMALAVIMVLASFALSFAAELPADVAEMGAGTEPVKEAVSALMDAGAVTGDVDGLFHPQDTLTRAQVSKMIVSLMGLSEDELSEFGSKTEFSDLEYAKWAAPYINYMAASGIASGYPDGTFGPSNNVTLAELAAFLTRACKIEPTKEAEGASWASQYVNAAVSSGLFENIVLANDIDVIRTSPATKSQAAIAIYNAKDRIVKYDSASGNEDDENKSDASDNTSENSDGDSSTSGGNRNDDSATEGSSQAGSTNAGTVVNTVPIGVNNGASGKYYVVVNDIGSVSDSAHSDSVAEITALIGGREIGFLANTSDQLTDMLNDLAATGAFKGTVYELNIKDDEVRDIATLNNGTAAGIGTVKNQYFSEIRTTTAGANEWLVIEDVDTDRSMVKVKDSTGVSLGWVEINPEASFYLLDKDGSDYSYSSSSIKSLHADRNIRLYQIHKHDGDTVADIVVFKRADV